MNLLLSLYNGNATDHHLAQGLANLFYKEIFRKNILLKKIFHKTHSGKYFCKTIQMLNISDMGGLCYNY